MAKFYWIVETQSETLKGGPYYLEDDNLDQKIESSKSSDNETRFLEVPNNVDENFVKIYNNSGTLELQADSTVALDDFRVKRLVKLVASDWTQLADCSETAQKITDWASYRTLLKDWPATPNTKAVKEFSIDAGSGQDDIKIEADATGPDENDITFEYKDPTAADQSLTVTVTDNTIEVSAATNGSSVITSTVQDVIDIVNNNSNSNVLVTATLVSGATGSNVADTASAETNLVGGGDAYTPYWPINPDGSQ